MAKKTVETSELQAKITAKETTDKAPAAKSGLSGELYERAKKIAKDFNVSVVYYNSSGDFFTNENLALNSETDKELVKELKFK